MIKQILSCDWGTSGFRLRLVSVEDVIVLREMTSQQGIAAVYNAWLESSQPESNRVAFYKRILQAVLESNFKENIKGIPIMMSGMASSTIGMKELEYGELPFQLKDMNLNIECIKADDDLNHDIFLVSGLKTANDVMRGEETMLLGFDMEKEEEALVIFPGTHSKHVVVKKNAAVDFKTYMTGEMFDLLASKSILSKSVVKNRNKHENIFIKGVQEVANNNFLNSLFHVRTNQLFKRYGAEENYHFLSGLVIGYELKEIASGGKNIYLVCSGNLVENYRTALKALNPAIAFTHYDADEALIKAHCRLSRAIDES
ncbi:MAG TPA: 2-dehydro-3-deoxygalactonokinase [Parafilimonas sp.]|nr:2-dehydro-3-deoxygalactonokinase [Parafilimonas sp.]